MFFVITVVVFSSKVTFRIIGGQPAPDYPFFVMVNRGFHQCGGTLVRLDAVLTAAHCLYFGAENRWASPLEVYILHGDFSSPNNWRVRYHSCERYWVHFMYEASRKGPRNPYDAAVIKLEDQVLQRSSSQHAILPFCSQDDQKWGKKLGFAIGLGLIKGTPFSRAERLMETTLQKIDCQRLGFNNKSRIFPGNYCYHFSEKSSLSDGDFSEPMVFKKRGIAVCLMGSSSFTSYCHTEGFFTTIFTPAVNLKYWLS